MAQADGTLVIADLRKLSNEELALRVRERQRQAFEYRHELIQELVKKDLAAIAKEVRKRKSQLS